MLKLLFVSGVLLAVSPAIAATQAQQPAGDAQQASKPAKDGADRIICENQEQIGSRIATKRICMTAQQWKDHEQRVQGQLNEQHSQVLDERGPT